MFSLQQNVQSSNREEINLLPDKVQPKLLFRAPFLNTQVALEWSTTCMEACLVNILHLWSQKGV